jgi:cellobiose phosphorylase
MMLASQVFTVMSGVAGPDQIRRLWKSAVKLLRDPNLRGFRLNTDFKEEQHDLGRAFSFVYGDKENGAFFSHMNVMFANALYARGYVHEGWTVLKSVIDMALASGVNRVFPCLPEYFNSQGRGMYAYLTGSASWFVLTMVTRVFGVRGIQGDLLIEPCLTKEQFAADAITLTRVFAHRRLNVVFRNPSRLEYGSYSIRKVLLDSREFPGTSSLRVRIPRHEISRLSADREHTIVIELG